jgi:peroxiredoxin
VPKLVLIDEREADVDATFDGDRAVVSAADLLAATGWELKPEGLCRGDVCVPCSLDDPVDLLGVASVLGRAFVVSREGGVAAFAGDPMGAGSPGASLDDLELMDVDGNVVKMSDSSGKKRLVITWASWCGCRYELPAWQELVEELRPHGLEAVAVSFDDSVEAAKPWVDEASLSFPAAVDVNHRVAELFGVINVPSTLWFDEEGRMVRPPTIAPGDDRWREYTGVDADKHHNALRDWVLNDSVDDSLMQRWSAPGAEDAGLARAHRRVGAWLHRQGKDDLAAMHFAEAKRLAPFDWTIRRGTMPLQGEDPFGQPLFDFWEEWEAAGKPSYGR